MDEVRNLPRSEMLFFQFRKLCRQTFAQQPMTVEGVPELLWIFHCIFEASSQTPQRDLNSRGIDGVRWRMIYNH
jgi:hypothetical protein